MRGSLSFAGRHLGVDLWRFVTEALGDEIALGGHELVETRRALGLGRAGVPVGGRADEAPFGARAGHVEQAPLLGQLAGPEHVADLALGRHRAPIGDVAFVLAQPPRESGRGGQRVVTRPVVGEDARPSAAGEPGHVDSGELEPLRLVDRHDLHRVVVGRVELGDILFGLIEQLQVLEEGGQPGVALDRGEAPREVEEAQQVLATAAAGGLPEPRPQDDRLREVERVVAKPHSQRLGDVPGRDCRPGGPASIPAVTT